MNKIKLPTGLRDEFGQFAENKDIISAWILKLLRNRSYSRINTPIIEQRRLFDDFATVNQQYRVFDLAGDDLVLRPDLTLPIARFLSNTNVSMPQRLYYIGEKFEISPELSGGKNEQTQVGIELIGYQSLKAEMEAVIFMHQLSKQFLNRHHLTIELAHAKLVDQVLSALQLDHQLHTQLAQALYHKNFPAYDALLAKLGPCDELPFLKKWPRMFGTVEEIKRMLESVAVPKAAQSSLNELITLAEFASSLPGQSVIIDLSSAAPQQYYTGIIFKGYTTNSNTYIVSGGRYDQLLANFESEIEPAVGLGINIDALASIADVEDSIQRPVFVYAKLPDLRQVVPLIEAHANYSLSLADTLDQAKQQALNAGGRLMIYQPGKGLTEC